MQTSYWGFGECDVKLDFFFAQFYTDIANYFIYLLFWNNCVYICILIYIYMYMDMYVCVWRSMQEKRVAGQQ